MTDAAIISKQVHLGILRARHNALVEVEEFCTGTAAKGKRYAPLLRHVAMLKDSLRHSMDAVDQPFAAGERQEKP